MMKGGDHLVVSAPGKVILHGEHAVVHGKRALACSLDLRTFLHVTRSPDAMIRMHLPDIGIYKEWPADDLKNQFSNTNNNGGGDGLVKTLLPSDTMFHKLCEFCGFDLDTQNTKELAVIAFIYLYTTILEPEHMVGLDFMVSSNLPTSAGLGSSAAFAVALVSSLLRMCGKIGDPGTNSFNAWTNDDLETINSWAFVAEKIIHGNPSGVDNSISTYGGVVKYQDKVLEKLDCKHELSVIITNTKVPRSTKQLVTDVGTKLNQYPAIIQPVLEAVEAISARCQVELTTDGSMNEEVVKELISANHYLLCVLGVNHPALEKVCRITQDNGLMSKLTGAGGGGCAFTFLPSDAAQETIDRVMADLRASQFDCWRTVVGGPGVGLHFGEPNTDFVIPSALESRAKLCNIL